MEENSKKKTFVLGAAILGVAGLITKLLGAVFRIPLTNVIGASGMGYYQTAYPIYVLLLSISTSGLPTAISRMVAERRAQEQYYEAQRVFKLSFYFMLCLGVVTGIGLFALAPVICGFEMEPDAVYAMRATAPALILCPVMSCLRGFFQGRRNMTPTAVSQVVEQLFRVGLGLFLAGLLYKIDAPHAAAGAAFGASAGAIFGLITVLFLYIKQKPAMEAEFTDKTAIKSNGEIFKEILVIAVPITIGACIMPILNSIDTLIVKRRLMSIGFSSDVARSMFGELTGMASPIINFPIVFSMAVCMSVVPVITDAFKRDDMDFVRENSVLSIRYASIIIMPCAAGMIALAEPIMKLLYPRQLESAVAAAGCLKIYAVGMVFLALVQAMTGVLQGIGRQVIPVRNLFFGALLKIAVTYVLTGIPSFNVKGAAVGTALAYALAAVLNFIAVRKYTEFKPDIVQALVKPLVSSALMGAFAYLAFWAAKHAFGNTVSTLIAIVCGVVVYAVLILVTGTIKLKEVRDMLKRR